MRSELSGWARLAETPDAYETHCDEAVLRPDA
jgi:hypothetical protein